MEVIDLLHEIRNGNIPTKIKYDGQIWEYSEKGENYFENDTISINWDYLVFNCLNDEIEIIEDKKIEKIKHQYEKEAIRNYKNANFNSTDMVNICKSIGFIMEYQNETWNKINEIIDKLNEMGDK